MDKANNQSKNAPHRTDLLSKEKTTRLLVFFRQLRLIIKKINLVPVSNNLSPSKLKHVKGETYWVSKLLLKWQHKDKGH